MPLSMSSSRIRGIVCLTNLDVINKALRGALYKMTPIDGSQSFHPVVYSAAARDSASWPHKRGREGRRGEPEEQEHSMLTAQGMR